MPKGRLVFDGDNLYTEKQKRVHKLTPEIEAKIDAIPGVVDSLDGTSTTDALSANMGRALQDQINAISGTGNFLSTWDCTTGLPITNPQEDPYTYKVGDYYVVSIVGATNYKPHGGTYTQGVPSTTIEIENVGVNDKYYFDGADWTRVPNTAIQISIDTALSTTSTNAVENRAIANAINTKENIISDLTAIRNGASAGATALQPNANISQLTNNVGYQTAGDVASAIQTAVQQLPTVNDGVLTIQKNSTTIDTFSANSASNKTINVSVPTTVAELSDASDYATKTYVDNSVGEAIEESKAVGPNTPSNPEEGQLWYDTTNDQLKVYDGTNWVVTGKVYSAGDGISITNDTISNTGVLSSNNTFDNIIYLSQSDYDNLQNKDNDTLYATPDVNDIAIVSDVAYGVGWDGDTTHAPSKNAVYDEMEQKQDVLISGTNIKTINNQSLLGDGNIDISGGGGYIAGDGISIVNDTISNTGVLSSNSTFDNIVYLSQSDYDNLQNKDNETLYATPDGSDVPIEYTAGYGIEMKDGPVYSAMRGPCSKGFHIPANTEWQAVYQIGVDLSIWSSSSTQNTKQYLKLPRAGYRNVNGAVANSTTGNVPTAWYWTSTPNTTGDGDRAYHLFVSSSLLAVNNDMGRVYGVSLRPFSDAPAQPNNTWTTLYDGSSVAAGAGIFHNATLGLISLSSDGANWITIADKNLGATTVYNDGDTLSQANCGNYYQRGNNYGFPWTGNVTISGTKVDASDYGPGNYYSSSTFATAGVTPWDWAYPANDNLWGGITGVVYNTISVKEDVIKSISVSGATIGGIVNSGTLHKTTYSSNYQAYDTTYTFTGSGYVILDQLFYNPNRNDRPYLYINGVCVFEDTVPVPTEQKYYVGPFTVGPGDTVRFYVSGSDAYMTASVYDFY